MKINILLTVLAALLAWAFLLVGNQAEALDSTRTIQGIFKQVKDNSIDIVEDPDGKEAQIAIDSNTVYDNVQKLTDLKQGDKVQIDYKMVQSKDTAITITKLEVEN